MFLTLLFDCDKDGMSALHWAIKLGDESVVEQILQIFDQDNNSLLSYHERGMYAVHLAAMHFEEDSSTLSQLLELSEAELERPSHDGLTPLLVAAQSGNEDAFRHLQALGANLAAQDASGKNVSNKE